MPIHLSILISILGRLFKLYLIKAIAYAVSIWCPKTQCALRHSHPISRAKNFTFFRTCNWNGTLGWRLWQVSQNLEVDEETTFLRRSVADVTVLNAFLIRKWRKGKASHQNFQEVLSRNVIILSYEENVTASGVTMVRSSQISSPLGQL